jgi:ferredoxin, 2Fe-2S
MNITWKLPDGSEIKADIADGTTLMQAAVANNVPGVIGECGGCMICATCHVYVADEWRARTGTPEEYEDATLDLAEAARRDASRLSCQITAAPELDGLVLILPLP